MEILEGKTPQPRRVFIYGDDAVGKSTMASNAPNVVFMDVEGGLNDIATRKTPRVKSWSDVGTCLEELISAKTKFDWLAIDTIDWVERLIWKQVADDAGKGSIADIGYSNGYKLAVAKWEYLIIRLDTLRTMRNCGIILLGHATVKKFNSPEHESYDRYQPALHDTASAILREWCDEVFFASYRIDIRKEESGYGQERSLAVGGQNRYLRTQDVAAVSAKSRLDLPAEMPMVWADYQAAIDEQTSTKPITKKEKPNG